MVHDYDALMRDRGEGRKENGKGRIRVKGRNSDGGREGREGHAFSQ